MKRVLTLLMVFILLLFSLGCEGGCVNDKEEFILKANVIKVESVIEVEVIESDYAFGVYWVLTSNETKFIGVDGGKINKEDLQAGATIEIVYGGQVMMSYPPQIAATKITEIK